MENSDHDKPEKKRPHLSSMSSTMAKNSTNPPANNKCVRPISFSLCLLRRYAHKILLLIFSILEFSICIELDNPKALALLVCNWIPRDVCSFGAKCKGSSRVI